MSSNLAINAIDLGKTYHVYPTPMSRLKQIIKGQSKQYYSEFVALKPLSFQLKRGEVVGIVGRNGAGKSTLLQLICGTLTPSSGECQVNGRIAALLELGAGFNPDFSGRENIYLSASVMGISRKDIDLLIEDIIDFSGVKDFIDQPVKTYSSGMYVRLAFSIATSVNPEILVIDEALSVGDGDFSRRSFDRIMQMRDEGTTILFCSHSLYQLETLCSRAIWLDQGVLMADGPSDKIVAEYHSFLDRLSLEQNTVQKQSNTTENSSDEKLASATRLTAIRTFIDNNEGKQLTVKSGKSTLQIEVEYVSQSREKAPGVAIVFLAASGVLVASSGTWNDGVHPTIDNEGNGFVRIEYPNLPLLKGRYTIEVVLFCERGLMIHDEVNHVATLEVYQDDAERGLIALPHRWILSDKLEADLSEQ